MTLATKGATVGVGIVLVLPSTDTRRGPDRFVLRGRNGLRKGLVSKWGGLSRVEHKRCGLRLSDVRPKRQAAYVEYSSLHNRVFACQFRFVFHDLVRD